VTTADPKQQRLVAGQLHFVALQQQTSDLHHLLVYSAIALGVMVMIAIVLGWFMAGRFLRPVRAITAAANDISATNLHERLRLTGPTDELKELGDTFDRLLERLEVSFESQRQFVANASHELRTPLTTMRASLDVAVGKPGPIPEETVVLAGRIRSELDQVDRLLESFLALARAERGLGVDDVELSLDELASAALERHAGAISSRELEVARVGELEVPVRGSETLLSRMVDNLVDNAIKHNEPGGWIRVTTQADGGIALLVVENGGPVIEDKSVEVLTQPFRRLGAQRTGSDSGTGLGLSIVASVAEAHGGTLALHALGNGGLQVVVELPLVAPVLAGVTA
jgi:signal transduction histidine kinase